MGIPMPPVRHFYRIGAAPHVVGVLDPCYSSSHVIYGIDGVKYIHQTLKSAPFGKMEGERTFFKFTPFILDAAVDLVHTWNAIPFNKNFVVSFELEIPRYFPRPTPRQARIAMRLLQSARCKKILALSEFAFRSGAKRMKHYGFPELVDKMQVFRGAVRDPLLLGDLPPRPGGEVFSDEPLTAVLIGSSLFRKGAMYSILAFEKLRKAGLNVRLTLIGDFEEITYPFGEFSPKAAEWTARAKSHEWIEFKGPIPNREVFKELRKHHICLYPSLDESLGWLVIEAQMLGVPVCGNRVCAFPELVEHMHTGWLTELPVAESERWEGIDAPRDVLREAIPRAEALVTQGIMDCVTLLYNNPGLIVQWGAAARERAISMYGEEKAAEQLDAIYDEALGR
ncbi:MAG TPA: glycosyltransferase family 4 protein [Acidisarcina sp.]